MVMVVVADGRSASSEKEDFLLASLALGSFI